ncbi:uncharacterized protein MKK02DRAFT_38708 [Dioszegia hungarica]|uniref:Uncharacterized protein n=1 Tax=Dioszegia hungarica TaxID=4972 RepID=A0AA38LUM3_9TREE|nr:uncharacterized protein MKK02DRAFT_38708 [Dioszegia hungarica]KAI9634036.1 hypothetical protein MKK02DRAFT_38708 [Dioszegia hungarica]
MSNSGWNDYNTTSSGFSYERDGTDFTQTLNAAPPLDDTDVPVMPSGYPRFSLSLGHFPSSEGLEGSAIPDGSAQFSLNLAPFPSTRPPADAFPSTLPTSNMPVGEQFALPFEPFPADTRPEQEIQQYRYFGPGDNFAFPQSIPADTDTSLSPGFFALTDTNPHPLHGPVQYQMGHRVPDEESLGLPMDHNRLWMPSQYWRSPLAAGSQLSDRSPLSTHAAPSELTEDSATPMKLPIAPSRNRRKSSARTTPTITPKTKLAQNKESRHRTQERRERLETEREIQVTKFRAQVKQHQTWKDPLDWLAPDLEAGCCLTLRPNSVGEKESRKRTWDTIEPAQILKVYDGVQYATMADRPTDTTSVLGTGAPYTTRNVDESLPDWAKHLWTENHVWANPALDKRDKSSGRPRKDVSHLTAAEQAKVEKRRADNRGVYARDAEKRRMEATEAEEWRQKAVSCQPWHGTWFEPLRTGLLMPWASGKSVEVRSRASDPGTGSTGRLLPRDLEVNIDGAGWQRFDQTGRGGGYGTEPGAIGAQVPFGFSMPDTAQVDPTLGYRDP